MRYYCIDKEYGIDALQLREKEQPQPGPGQVLVRLRAAALNYRDLLVIGGSYGRNLPRPLVPLSDGAGEVVRVGPGVTRWQPGDRVAGTFFQEWEGGEITDEAPRSALGGAIDGVLAEYALFREGGLVALPAHLSFTEGATLPCAGLTAWHCLMSGGLACGSTVLTLGSGGVSTFAMQFARAAGARVIATTGSAAKMARLQELGASHVIDYRSEPAWEKRVLELTDGRGVDIVVEVGGAGTLAQSMKATRLGGHISLIGVLAGQQGEVSPLPAVMRNLRIQGIYVGSRQMFLAMNRAMELHAIRPVIDRLFPFAEARDACHYLASGAHFGKVVIEL